MYIIFKTVRRVFLHDKDKEMDNRQEYKNFN
jgi:hypothetical protein